MCGIAGIIKYGKEPLCADHLRLLLVGLMRRGNDATGVAVQYEDGSWNSLKSPVPAWNFVSGKDFDHFIEENMKPNVVAAILHTRAATQGSPNEPDNNHPLVSDHCALIHNGCINNENTLFKDLKLKRQGEVDSDILRAIVEEHGITAKAVSVLNKVSGSAAIAAIHTSYPRKMLIARSGSPIVIGSTPEYFAFASEKHILHRALRPLVSRFGVQFRIQTLNTGFSPFPDNTAWIMGPNGLEGHYSFHILSTAYVTPDYDKHTSNYAERQKRWSSAKSGTNSTETYQPKKVRKHITCPHCKREWILRPDQENISVCELLCDKANSGCGRTMDKGTVKYILEEEK